jgi:hypothetical protein
MSFGIILMIFRYAKKQCNMILCHFFCAPQIIKVIISCAFGNNPYIYIYIYIYRYNAVIFSSLQLRDNNPFHFLLLFFFIKINFME